MFGWLVAFMHCAVMAHGIRDERSRRAVPHVRRDEWQCL